MKIKELKLTNYFLILMLLLLNLPAQAADTDKTEILSAYFNSNDSLILETDGNLDLGSAKKLIDGDKVFYVLQLDDFRLDSKVLRNFQNDLVNLNFVEKKEGRIFKKTTAMQLIIESKEKRLLSIENREVLRNRAYELKFNPGDFVDFNELAQVQAASLPIKKEEDLVYHQLSVQANDMFYYDFSNEKTASEKFVDDLDPKIVREAINKEDYKRESFNRMESGNLYLIAEALVKHGYNKKALDAYRKAVEINPQNMEARLGLAQHTTDAQEKVSNYIKTFDTTALLTVGEEWLKTGLEKSNSKVIGAALVAYQFGILKDPINPNLRFKYGQALEKAGEDYYEDSAKRYLEAAAIAKKKYKNGEAEVEDLLRGSIESLIKVLSKQGEFKEANKYCKSYLALGFKQFIEGDPIMAVQKQINKQHNPFN